MVLVRHNDRELFCKDDRHLEVFRHEIGSCSDPKRNSLTSQDSYPAWLVALAIETIKQGLGVLYLNMSGRLSKGPLLKQV